jgi:hypothetical protein
MEQPVIQAKVFLCADSAAIDARTNALSAFHIMEQLNAPSFPVAIPRVSMIAVLTRQDTDPSNVQLQLQIYSGNQQLFVGPMAVNFAQQLNARTVAEMHGLVVPAPGVLSFVLRNGDETLSSWTVLVSQVGQMPLQIFLPPTHPRGGPVQ